MKTQIKKIIEALEEVKTLEDATLEEMDMEIRKTSSCILVDADGIKEARNWIEIHNGKIGTFFECVSGDDLKIECSFRQLVSQNIRAAHQGDTAAQFVKDARLLASMLEKAAKRVERKSANDVFQRKK